jgi:hypothetical protein
MPESTGLLCATFDEVPDITRREIRLNYPERRENLPARHN